MPMERFEDSFFDQLGRSPGVVSAVVDARDRVAATWRASAPVETGQYKRGIMTALKYQKRVVGLIIGTDSKTLLIEARLGLAARAVRQNGRRRA